MTKSLHASSKDYQDYNKCKLLDVKGGFNKKKFVFSVEEAHLTVNNDY